MCIRDRLLIKYIEEGEPDENGVRTLTFQVNGMLRTVKIQDKNLEIKADRKLKADKTNPQHLGSSIQMCIRDSLHHPAEIFPTLF